MNGCGTEPAARLTTSRWVTSAGHENARNAADMNASLGVGLAIRPAPEWVICAARRAADTA
jgi:hypothetical protein